MVATAAFLLLAGLFSVFIALVALNGVMDRRASTALILLSVFLVGAWVFSCLLSGWLVRFFQGRFRWRGLSAGVVAILTSTCLGVFLFFISILASILLAGIK